jgi:AcrR family transcriptional regulator
VRAEQARQSRELILAAARDLFLQQGYPATTIEQIARRAGVSRPTVYAAGSKAGLFKLVRDRAIAGDDDPTPMPERSSHMTFAQEPTPTAALRSYAGVCAAVNRRLAPANERLREAAAADPDLARLWQVSEDERLTGARIVMGIVAGKGPLRPDLDTETAAGLLWALNAPETYHRLVTRQGWSGQQYTYWLGELLVRTLLPAS